MKDYGYWISGGYTGKVQSTTAYGAAKKACFAEGLSVEPVFYCGFTRPWLFTNGINDIKIWEVR